MTLEDREIIVVAATGQIGGVTARTLAREGARVWASGRDAAAVARLVADVRAGGGRAEGDVLDATDPGEVDRYVASVAERAGRVDGVFNAIGLTPAELGYPAPLPALDIDAFMRPQRVILGSTFLTSRAAGGVMAQQGGGSIVTLSAALSGLAVPFMAALTATCGAIEAMTRSMAAELGTAGVRVNCVRGSAMPETTTIQETFAGTARILGFDDPARMPPPPGGVLPPITVAQTAAAVAFLMSDAAAGTSAQVVDVGSHVMP